MFLRQYTETIDNPPPRSRWKTKQIAIFGCDFCKKEIKTSKNIKKKMERKLHFCSKKCRACARRKGGIIYKQSSKRMQKQYGVDHIFSHPSVVEKRKNTMKKLYGVENASTLKWVKEKKKQTLLSRYGKDSPFKIPEFIEKSRKTCKKRYGCDFAMQSEAVKEKYKNTCLERYGVRNFSLSKEFADIISNKEYKNLPTKTGHCTINNKKYYYRSSYELYVLNELMKNENKIVNFMVNYQIPYLYKGKKYKYLADFFLETKSGIFIIETKNKFLLSMEKTKAKILAAINLCKKNQWQFILLHNDNINTFDMSYMFW